MAGKSGRSDGSVWTIDKSLENRVWPPTVPFCPDLPVNIGFPWPFRQQEKQKRGRATPNTMIHRHRIGPEEGGTSCFQVTRKLCALEFSPSSSHRIYHAGSSAPLARIRAGNAFLLLAFAVRRTPQRLRLSHRLYHNEMELASC